MRLRALSYKLQTPLTSSPMKLGIMSDLHIGRKDTDEKRIAWELKQHDKTIIVGDVLNLIGHFDHKRFTAQLTKSGSIDASTNAEIDRALAILGPHKDKIIGIGTGNHESEYLKRHGVDVTSILCRELGCMHLWYAGFLRLDFHNKDKQWASTTIYYNHGQGGSADRSRSVLDFDYYYTTYMADMYCLGHAHKKIMDQNRTRIRMGAGGKSSIIESPMLGIRTGCYRKELEPAQGDYYQGDFGTERFKVPETRGGAIVELSRGVDRCRSSISMRGYFL